MSVFTDISEIILNRDLLEPLREKKVLITGATGLLGSMLIKVFFSANIEYGLNIEIIGQARSFERAKTILGDISDQISLNYSNDFDIDVCCDYIIHTACPTTSKFFVEHPVSTIDTIIFGTKAMLELAKRNNAVFVYLSSMEEYGVPYTPGEIMTEDKVGIINHLTPRSCYPEGKRMCECMCAAYSSEFGVDTRIARLAQTFGAGIPIEDNRVSMQFAKSVVKNTNIVLHTEGKSISNFCYLSDAITGILTVLAKGKTSEAYNICNDVETRSIYEIAKLVSEEVAEGRISVIMDIPKNENYGYAPDNTMRLCSEKLKCLGWSPRVSMVQAYRRLVDYLLTQNRGE